MTKPIEIISILLGCCFGCFLISSNEALRNGNVIPQCRGYNNEPVDWFFVYKLPKRSKSSEAAAREGVAFIYMTNKEPYWQTSKENITSENSMVGYTLAPLYRDKNTSLDTLWFMYNDQPPNKPYSAEYGHAKGVLMTGKSLGGFWLIHSVPNFPPLPNSGQSKGKVSSPVDGKYSYPLSGTHYGQNFLCVSTNNADLNEIGTQLMYNQIIVYRYKLPEDLSLKYANLTAAAKQKRIKRGPFNRVTRFHSIAGMNFTSFAKSDKWKKDLYDDFIAPEFNVNLYVESWLNGPGKLPTDCNKTVSVKNVKTVYMNIFQDSFKSTVDHSKWAVQVMDQGDEKMSPSHWVCIGDINRAKTQFKRGGGAVCLNHPDIWQAYLALAYDVEPCPIGPKDSKRKNRNTISSYISQMGTRIKSWFG